MHIGGSGGRASEQSRGGEGLFQSIHATVNYCCLFREFV